MADITYDKIKWENEPSHNTPLSAENLNKMDTAIYDLVTKSNSLVPNPAESPTEGLEKLEYDGTVYEVKGGHKILNDSGSILTQKDEMRFGGVYTHNASTITEVDIVREFQSVSEIEALTGEAQKGFQARINGNSYEPFKATDIGFNKTGTSFTSDDVDGVLREVDTVNTYTTQDNKVTVKVIGHTYDVYLSANVVGGITADGIQLPNSIKPDKAVHFVGKAGDNWYQPYRIDTNGLLTARSGNDVNAIAVDWAIAHTTFIK